jgi:hypothetical protein
MTYRGIVSNGVVILDGDKPAEGTVVEITPVATETETSAQGTDSSGSVANHPAIGIWKDRKDLPEDSVEAAKVLGERLMRRTDE